MKRLIGPSKTITHQLVRSKSKTRRPYSRDRMSNDVNPRQFPNSVVSNIKRHVYMSTVDGREDGIVDLDVSRHNMPEKLNWYWNLDEEHKRKITDPTYVKQAVQDTFMQRAQGGYHYKRSGPVRRNSASAKSTPAGHQWKAEVVAHLAKATPEKPPPEKPIPRPQVPKRKRLIDTARPIQQYPKPKVQPEQRKAKSGSSLKEEGQKQLAEAKKKFYDPAPIVMDYLVDKHSPKTAGVQVGSRKEKLPTEASQLPRVPSLMQKVFGWKGEPKKSESEISITPRSIEVRKSPKKIADSRQKKKTDGVGTEDGRGRKARRPQGKLRLTFKGSAKKESPVSEKRVKKQAEFQEEKRAREIQAEEDRKAIWSKMKVPTAPDTRSTEERPSVKKQVRDLELTPQIYPRGSLSMRKSYLPITACRPRMEVGRPTESRTSVYAVNQQQKQPMPVKESPSITGHILDSLKNILSKMRPNSA